jgi:hypothetical protein
VAFRFVRADVIRQQRLVLGLLFRCARLFALPTLGLPKRFGDVARRELAAKPPDSKPVLSSR